MSSHTTTEPVFNHDATMLSNFLHLGKSDSTRHTNAVYEGTIRTPEKNTLFIQWGILFSRCPSVRAFVRNVLFP